MNAIITGASQGIGKAIAEKLAANGIHLVLCSRSIEKLAALKMDLSQAYPNINIYVESVDVSDKAAVLKFASNALKEFKNIDLLINNAGTFIPGSICSEEDGNMEKMIETNLYSAYHLSRAIVPSMIEQKKGHIFNMCSIASQMAYDNGGSYSISKFALLGFSKCLREEMKPHNIKVTHLMPGATRTPSWDGVDLPDERFIPAKDIAEIVWSTYTLSQSTNIEDIVVRPQLGDI
jgi:NADP-dependent 3-hydroxy acid dehydrogenase YdfG